MIYFYKIQLCVKKIAKRRKKRFSPIYFDIFFSKKIAKSSSKAPKKESFEAKIGCLTILQKVIYLCYILCTKVRILRLVKKEKKSRLIVWTFTKVPNSIFFCFSHHHQTMTFSKHFEFAAFFNRKKEKK